MSEAMDPLTLLVKYGLVDKGNGTIYDTKTKLTWQQIPSRKQYTWEEAHKYCKRLRLAGHKDWRLPTKEELKSLIEKEHEPTICPVFECELYGYWSSTTFAIYPDSAWFVDFYDGLVYSLAGDAKGYHFYVRAVRKEKRENQNGHV